jgi:hypothetical protein
LLNHLFLYSEHSTTQASAIDYAKDDKQIDVTVAAYEGTTPQLNKNDKTRERCDEEGSTCRSVRGDGSSTILFLTFADYAFAVFLKLSDRSCPDRKL